MPQPLSTLPLPRAWVGRRGRRRRLLLALGCFVAVVVAYWVALLGGQQAQLREARAQAQLRASQMAHATSIQVQTLLSGMDATLQGLASVYARREQAGFDHAVRSLASAYPPGVVLQVAVADARGDIVYSSLEPQGRPQAAVSIRDREHFQVQAQGRAEGLYVGRPVRGRVSQQWSIQLTRALRSPEGAFAGVLVLSLSPEHMAQYLRALASGSGGEVLSLVRTDGIYLARSQALEDSLGQSLAPLRLARFDAAQEQGVDLLEADHGAALLGAWSRVPGRALLVLADLDLRAVLAPLQRAQRAVRLRDGAGTLLITLGALWSLWLVVRHERSERRRLLAERRFALLAHEAPGGLFEMRVEQDGRPQLAFSTAALRRMHGIAPAPAPLDPATLMAAVHRADRPALRASIRRSLATLEPWNHRYRVDDAAQPQGVRWLHGHARAQRDEEGRLSWYGYVHDVTRDEALQEGIRRSEERLRLAVGAVRDGLWQWDCHSGRVHWDARCYEMLGHADQAFPLDFEGLLQRVHPADRERVRAELQRHRREGGELRLEARMATAERGWRSIEMRGGVAERDRAGRPLRLLGTQTDIQQRVEQARLIHALLDRSSALIFVATPGRDISYANERAARAFGLPVGDQPPGQSLQRIHPNRESFEAFGALYRQLQASGTVHAIRQLRTAGSRLHWFDMQGTLLDPDDERGAVIWTLMDIDARRRAELALEQAQQTVAALIDRFPSGILIADARGRRVVAANRMLMHAFGSDAEPSTLVGLPLAVLGKRLPQGLRKVLLRRDGQRALPTGRTLHGLPDGRFLEVESLHLREGERSIGHCWVVSDVTERRQREARLETLALTDALTGVPNRRAFEERMATELQHLRAGLVPAAAVVLLDIDHFKQVNDTHGHAIGDVVLRELAQTVAGRLRRQDMLGRIGGEEFAVLLSGATAEEGLRRAEELRRAVAQREIAISEERALRITISLGVSALDGQDDEALACLERADAAMYFSKRHGRNRATLWSADLPPLSSRAEAAE